MVEMHAPCVAPPSASCLLLVSATAHEEDGQRKGGPLSSGFPHQAIDSALLITDGKATNHTIALAIDRTDGT